MTVAQQRDDILHQLATDTMPLMFAADPMATALHCYKGAKALSRIPRFRVGRDRAIRAKAISNARAWMSATRFIMEATS
jgi:hypothetical protein